MDGRSAVGVSDVCMCALHGDFPIEVRACVCVLAEEACGKQNTSSCRFGFCGNNNWTIRGHSHSI